jgi:hypothetical protein
MEKVQVRAANGAACDFHDGVSGILDLGVGNGIVPDVFFSVPNERLHVHLLLPDDPQ